MPFWKKGEDPWDIDPEKRRRPPEETAEAGETGEPAPGLLEELRDWNEARKQKKAESVPPPIPCPLVREGDGDGLSHGWPGHLVGAGPPEWLGQMGQRLHGGGGLPGGQRGRAAQLSDCLALRRLPPAGAGEPGAPFRRGA